MAILRDLCLTIGLVLERTNYNIFELKEFEPKESLPFAYKNIAGLIPIPKRIKQIPKEVQMLVQLGDS